MTSLSVRILLTIAALAGSLLACGATGTDPRLVAGIELGASRLAAEKALGASAQRCVTCEGDELLVSVELTKAPSSLVVSLNSLGLSDPTPRATIDVFLKRDRVYLIRAGGFRADALAVRRNISEIVDREPEQESETQMMWRSIGNASIVLQLGPKAYVELMIRDDSV